MKLPGLLYGNNKTRMETVAFGGLNTSENHREGEFEHTENLSCRRWPAVCPRQGRDVVRECTGAPSALYAWEKLAVVEGTDFLYDGVVKGQVSAGPKQICRVGNEIVIWPDKKYYNFVTDTFTALEVGFSIPWHNSCVLGSRWIAVPQVSHDFVSDGTAETVYNTGWLGVSESERNPKLTIYAGSGPVVGTNPPTRQVYYNQLIAGNRIQTGEGEFAKRVTANTGEAREYMPGVMRNWQTVSWEMRVYNEQTGKNETVTGAEEGWAYTNDAQILNAQGHLSFSDCLRKGKTGYATAYLSLTAQQSYLKLAEVGDIVNYNADTGEADRITAIERKWYSDHYYVTQYRTEHVVTGEVHSYEDPEASCAALGIAIGDRVRVSRGEKSVATKVSGFSASQNNSGPLSDHAVLGINFADSLAALSGESGDVSIDRVTDPDLSFICSHDNRLWGVSGRRIYCSKYDDPQDFDTQTGTDADAWWADVGSPGEFTGIVSYSGAVLCFKENLVHKVLGDLPSEFTVSTYHVSGIQPGSHQSAAILNEVLYYKGTAGIYAYNGYTPQLISENFGERRYSEAVGGTDGARYWVSMKDETEAWGLFCYDPATGIWMREDGLHAAAFSLYDGRCYAADYEGERILTFGGADDDTMPWEGVTAPLHEGSFDRKLYTKLLVRAKMAEGAKLQIEISYDGKPWETLYNTRAPRWRVAILPVRPRRCDSFRLRICGRGDVTLLGIAREVMTGSER